MQMFPNCKHVQGVETRTVFASLIFCHAYAY